MTTLNNIMNLITPAAQKTAQGNGLSQKSPTLSDFLGMILSPTDAAAAQQNLPLSQTDIKALTEKIAAMLNGKGVENSPTLSTGIMQILSAPMATEIQQTNALPAAVDADMPLSDMSEADMADMARMLNDIEPGANGAADNTVDMDAEIAALINRGMTAQPQEDMAAALAAKIAALLQQQQATDTGLQTQTAALSATTSAATAAATPAITGGQGLAALQNILQLQGEQPQAQQQHPLQNKMPNAAAADDAPLPAPQQPAAEAKPDSKPLPQAPAVTGQNNSNNGLQNGFGQNGFGQNSFTQNGFTFFAGVDGGMTATDAGGMQNLTQNFAHYNAQAAAQSLPAQTTQMIAVQIQRNAAAKVDSFTLQLEPADLGRLDVELKFHRDGSVHAHLAADRPETLAMLQKDSAHLERILQQAGFDTKDGALSFDLRQQSDGNNAGGTGTKRAGGTGNAHGIDNNEAAQNAAAETRQTGYIGLQGVNIMV